MRHVPRTPSTRNCSRLKISPPKRRQWHAVTRWRRCWTMKVSWQIFVVSRCRSCRHAPSGTGCGAFAVCLTPGGCAGTGIGTPATGRSGSAQGAARWTPSPGRETTERLQRHARETLNDQAPDFSRLTQLLALLPGAVQTTTQEIPSQPQAIQAGERRHQ